MSESRYPLWRSIEWPGQAKVAVQIIVAFEAFDERSQFTTEPRPGINTFSLSYGEYGAHVGAWRLLKVLTEYGAVSSVAINGLAAERHPEVIRAFADGGHELVGHGWVNDQFMAGGEAEQGVIKRTLDAIEAAGGTRPVGWVSPGKLGSVDTEEYLLDAGVIYTGDDASDDLPFVKKVGNREFAVVPTVDLGSNDLIHLVFGQNSPDVLVDSFIATFDAVYGEAEEGRPGAVGLVLHCHASGRPTMLGGIRRMLEHCANHDGVWFARGDELARFALTKGMYR